MTIVVTHTGSPTVSRVRFSQSKFPENRTKPCLYHCITGMPTASHPIKTSQTIFPAKTLKQPPIYLDNHNNRVQDWLVPSRTFKRWNGAWSLMKRESAGIVCVHWWRDISCHQMKLFWKLNQFSAHSTSQHSATQWSDWKLVSKEVGLRAQWGTLYSTNQHSATRWSDWRFVSKEAGLRTQRGTPYYHLSDTKKAAILSTNLGDLPLGGLRRSPALAALASSRNPSLPSLLRTDNMEPGR